MARVMLEIREVPTPGSGCSPMDRRTFRRRTVARLQEEFGPLVEVRWTEPARAAHTLPTIMIQGDTVHTGGYLPWEILRPMVASALALELGVCEFNDEAVRRLKAEGLPCEDWQEGLLRWLDREQGFGTEEA